MTIKAQAEKAFGRRHVPKNLVERRSPVTPEQRDAMWFAGKKWQEITREDWEIHADAFFAFLPEAFVYYLPSIVVLSAEMPTQPMLVAGSLLRVLDRDPEVYHWDAFIQPRLVGLEHPEYEVLKAWVLAFSNTGVYGSEDTIVRAYETVELLQKETQRVRALVNRDNKSS